MPIQVINLAIFSPAELQDLLILVKAEINRAIGGRIVTGSSAAQSYGLDKASLGDLIAFANSIAAYMGLGDFETRVRPDFNGCGYGGDPTRGP